MAKAKKAKAKAKKNNTKLIIGIAAGGVVLIAAVVVALIFFLGGSKIKSLADLKTALKNKEAINCTVEKDGAAGIIQTSAGLTRVKVAMDDPESGTLNVLLIKDDAVYTWDKTGKNAYKTAIGNMLDEVISDIEDAPDDGDGSIVFKKCESPNKADLNVPKDIDFIDYNKLLEGIDTSNYGHDSDYDFDFDWDWE